MFLRNFHCKYSTMIYIFFVYIFILFLVLYSFENDFTLQTVTTYRISTPLRYCGITVLSVELTLLCFLRLNMRNTSVVEFILYISFCQLVAQKFLSHRLYFSVRQRITYVFCQNVIREKLSINPQWILIFHSRLQRGTFVTVFTLIQRKMNGIPRQIFKISGKVYRFYKYNFQSFRIRCL